MISDLEFQKGSIMSLYSKKGGSPDNMGHQSIKPTKAKVLLVDDYEANILIAGTYLEYLGLTYDIASNGFDAVQLVSEHQYVVILMDIQMPGMDGIKATSLIREMEQTNGRPRQAIIAFTASPELTAESQRQLFGLDDYICKPFVQSHLEEVLTKYINICGLPDKSKS